MQREFSPFSSSMVLLFGRPVNPLFSFSLEFTNLTISPQYTFLSNTLISIFLPTPLPPFLLSDPLCTKQMSSNLFHVFPFLPCTPIFFFFCVSLFIYSDFFFISNPSAFSFFFSFDCQFHLFHLHTLPTICFFFV